MGGEKSTGLDATSETIGSPPRGRGKDHLGQRFHRRAGITPAWAGKSSSAVYSTYRCTDHPRVGGEKMTRRYSSVPVPESPPRGRGKGAGNGDLRLHDGITPAWAGKSSPRKQSEQTSWDHPRMGGEKPLFAAAAARGRGSPPHGRGKDIQERFYNGAYGITPAWAGKSFLRVDVHEIPGDHPRMGGEKLVFQLFQLEILGSPPHGRGKDRHAVALADGHRITPAWAGKRLKFVQVQCSHKDHPRMGGEKKYPFPPRLVG